MSKLSDFKIECKEHEVDDDLINRIEGMMEDSFYEFALESIEKIWCYVQETGNIKNWMIKSLDALEKYKERENGQQ